MKRFSLVSDLNSKFRGLSPDEVVRKQQTNKNCRVKKHVKIEVCKHWSTSCKQVLLNPQRSTLQNLSCFMCAGARIISTSCVCLQDFYTISLCFSVCLLFFFFPLLFSPWLTCLSLTALANNRSAGKCLMQEHGRSSGRWLRTPQESIFSAVTAQWQLIGCFRDELRFPVSLPDDGGFSFSGFLLLCENDGL